MLILISSRLRLEEKRFSSTERKWPPLLQFCESRNPHSRQAGMHYTSKGSEEQATELQSVCQWMEAALSMLESSIKPRPSCYHHDFAVSQAQSPSPPHQDHRRENASQANLTIKCWLSTFAAILSRYSEFAIAIARCQ